MNWVWNEELSILFREAANQSERFLNVAYNLSRGDEMNFFRLHNGRAYYVTLQDTNTDTANDRLALLKYADQLLDEEVNHNQRS